MEAKFNVEPPWAGVMKVCSDSLGHMTSVATMPILKNFKKSSCLDQTADDLES